MAGQFELALSALKAEINYPALVRAAKRSPMRGAESYFLRGRGQIKRVQAALDAVLKSAVTSQQRQAHGSMVDLCEVLAAGNKARLRDQVRKTQRQLAHLERFR